MTQGDLFLGAPGEGRVVGGKYRLSEKISEGGGGIVWKAADPEGRGIALKFLKWSPLKSRKVVAERFKNEFSILKSLSHPNISQIYDFGLDADSGLYFFTSELLTAGDLGEMMGASLPVIEELLLQALRALEYLRSHKLLHLDIKPQNLLLRHNGTHPMLAVIDFGLATFRPPDKPGGTANYMPPEMIVRRLEMAEAIGDYPPPDHRSDLYSLGATFYSLLTSVQPFCVMKPNGTHIDAFATLDRHLEYTPPPPSAYRREVPPYLDRIVMKLMARHPDDRYPSAIVAAQALQYSSPTEHAPESPQTLLAYLPKEGRLIGRHREQKIIEECIRGIALDTAHAAPVLCIAGGRGMGRTRLLMAAKPFAQQLEMEVSAVEDGGLSALLEEEGASNRPRLILMDDLHHHLSSGAHEDDTTIDPTAPRDATTKEALRTLIRRLRLQQRLKAAPGARLLFTFTINTDRIRLADALEELSLDETICHVIELKAFTTAEVAEYLTALLGEMPDAVVVDQLKRCTDGNPLFLTEHLEEMIAKGRLFSLAGRPDAKTLRAIGIDFSQELPSRSLARTIAEKLELLPPEARDLALVMACFGRGVSAEELREASGDKTASHELLLLVSAGLIQRDSQSGRFAFVNSLAARIIQLQAEPRRRALHHDDIARFLRRQRGARREDLDLHIAYGSNAAARLPALERLAERSIERHEPQIAAGHLEELLKALPADDLPRRADVLTRLGSAYESARLYESAQAAYKRLRLLKAPGDLRRQFRIKASEQLGLLAMHRRDLGNARRHIQEAIDLIKDEPSMLAWRLKLENHLAGIDLRDGRFEEAAERFERTADVAEKMLSPAELSTITNNELGEALLRGGKARRALLILRWDLERAAVSGTPEKVATLHLLIGDALRHGEEPRFDEALSHYQEGLKLARHHRMVELEVRLHNGLGNLCLKLGRAEAALSHYKEGLKLAQQIEGETTSVELMIGMGLAAQHMDRPDGTIEYFEAALEFSGGPKGASAGLIRRYRPTIYVSLGDAYYKKHDFERAEAYLHEALELDRQHALSPDLRYSLYGTYVEIFLARGDRDAAKAYLPTLSAIARVFPTAQPHLASILKRIE